MKSPGHRQHPTHRIVERRDAGRLRVQLGADVLAESNDVIEVDEDGNPRRFYFPRADVRMDALAPSETHSHCPFKGDARYFSLKFGDGLLADAAWSYETPYEEHAGLAGRIAFWSEKFEDLQVKPAG
jgi:uncharacterized protein (DUF427 family)